MTKILTAQEVSDWLGLHVNTVWQLAKNGQIPGRRIGRQWFFRADIIERYIAGENVSEEAAVGAASG